MALWDAGDKVGVPSTAYRGYRNASSPLRGGPRPATLATRGGFEFPTPAQVEAAAAGDGIAGLILSSPSNPTGAAERRASFSRRRDLRQRWRAPSPTIYHHIAYGAEPSPSAVDLPGAVVVNSPSSSRWRLAPAGSCSRPATRSSPALRAPPANLFINAPTVSQIAATAAFDDVDDALDGTPVK
ncbi:transferase [Aureococcus anophagefferens]|nr:transferase [Aureococcus anophagefferens]